MVPRPAPGTGRWWVIGILAIGLSVVIIVWLNLRVAADRITAETTGFRINDERSVTVYFEVSRPPGVAVTCTLQAMDSGFGTVGTASTPVPATDERLVKHSGTVRTTSTAVTGLVQSCVRP